MCGRYKLDNDFKLKQITKNLNYQTGDIYPTNNILTFISTNKVISAKVCKWSINNKIINIRLESIETKYNHLKNNRCVIIASGFYEWLESFKFYINIQDNKYIYLAGLYNDNNECAIITENAYKQMKSIHSRIPVILNHQEMINYLNFGLINHTNKDLLITPTQMSTLL